MAHLDEFAKRLVPAGSWETLTLPARDGERLREAVDRVKRGAVSTRPRGARAGRATGVTALFLGPQGTGKTMAAEVMAHELGRDLYRVDLSRVVSRYIGETEKNLGHVFDAAEALGAVLLLDEADALFGKRSEVKDSHDRFANQEVTYLLLRMEAYQGLTILAANLKNAIDDAFVRRFGCVVEFKASVGNPQRATVQPVAGRRSRRDATPR